MLIVEIALGIVLAAFIWRYLPLMLGLALSAATVLLSLGLAVAVVVLVVAYPRLLYALGVAVLIAALLVSGKYLRAAICGNYERFPLWLRRFMGMAVGVRWSLLLFSMFLGLVAWLVAFFAVSLLLGVAVQSVSDTVLATLFLVGPIFFGVLIYQLPWPDGPLKKARKSKDCFQSF